MIGADILNCFSKECGLNYIATLKHLGFIGKEKLPLKRLGYFGGWSDWGGGGLDRAIAAKSCTMVVCDVIYKLYI